MKRLKEALTKPWVAYVFSACCAVLLYLFFSNITAVGRGVHAVFHALSPIIIGIVVAYLANPLADFFEKKG